MSDKTKMKIGNIKVARRIYPRDSYIPIDPKSIEGYKDIIVMASPISVDKNCSILPLRHEYGTLSPFYLRVQVDGFPNGVIHENYWQFSKVYEELKPIKVQRSQKYRDIVFEYDGGVHIDKFDKITTEWENWKNKGFNTQTYVRYPVGYKKEDKEKCKFSLLVNSDGSVDYSKRLNKFEARKLIYFKSYYESVITQDDFKKIQKELYNGQNFRIIEVDGPHEEHMDYYKSKYNVDDNFIVNNTIDVTIKNMKILINDDKVSFGHGYCLGSALLGEDVYKEICEIYDDSTSDDFLII